ncbi:MAG: peptidylprolyl isomerase [Saprospiraceae bacterium]|nr:peptidylprolyl isomerase [Saprospiraceae bacterium]
MKRLIKLSMIIFLLVVTFGFSFGQDKVIFTVEDEPVYLDEFLYIYEKTNRDKADFSRASVEEYLDLYKKFKLKVHKARQMQLDTIQSLQAELAGYRKQLANAYLSDREVLESLTQEAYERMLKDISFSHILIKVATNASKEEEEKAYQKALKVLERLRGGEDFSKVALEVSDDPTVRKNDGRVGYVTAMLPDGFYDLETAIYTLPPRTFSRPIRSKLGFHIVMTDGERDARGEMEVSQILIRNKPNLDSKNKIDSLYNLLEAGGNFAELARKYSDDKNTASQGGYLGFFGINKYESIFENTAFRLKEDGEFSRPVRSSIGWHIIKRISHKPIPPYQEIRRTLEAKVKADSRYEVAEKSMLEKIKDENKFKELDWNRNLLLKEIGNDYLNYKWTAPESYTNQELFYIGDQPVKADKFLAYLTKNAASRLRINRSMTPEQALNHLYEEFVEDSLKEYQESQLEIKYPEFKALMREYSEGILLFEATKMKVWDKASEDSTGLREYFMQHRNNYLWPERALVETITINSTDDAVINKILKQIPKKSGIKLIKKFNKDAEVIKSQTILRDKEELDPALTWTKNSMTAVEKNEEKGTTTLKRVAEIVTPQPKNLEEARGYVIADYQDFLEKKWVEDLMKEFTVKVNEDVVNSIIKS